MNKNYHTIQVFLKETLEDRTGDKVGGLLKKHFSIDSGKIIKGKLYVITYPLSDKELTFFAEEGVSDKVLNYVKINLPLSQNGFQKCIVIAKLPGVTDDEGMSAQQSLFDMCELSSDSSLQHIFSQDIYLIEKDVPDLTLKTFAEDFLCNKLINHISRGSFESLSQPYIPEVKLAVDKSVEEIEIDLSDEELLRLSRNKLLSLDLEEMRAVKNYYLSDDTKKYRAENNLSVNPTDCELEIVAQTWSEHCKHKEFNAVIDYADESRNTSYRVNSLFKTYIKAATDVVQSALEKNGRYWLVKVFSDNAGIVKINNDNYFVWKVETHNSPSAIDPYGGAITGILGNNRDPLGTGIGGAKLLFNTNVLCFGPPSYSLPLLQGQLHPKRIFEGVRKGIEDGGNKSGIPTVNGSVIFDDRYSGKPLVYCGTGGVMPKKYLTKPTELKPISPGNKIVSIGGRVGKDGIHGATFSSREIDEHSPRSAVQIGSPIVQKIAGDFLRAACERGLIETTTDCGAGGLSSAIGELASISNGAVVRLENVLLKYSGLKPWEIFLSESQERMILVVSEDNLNEVLSLAKHLAVEAAVIGEFADTGRLTVLYNEKVVADIDIEFLHNGVPKKYLSAEWTEPEKIAADFPKQVNYNQLLTALMRCDAISSREYLIRQYDHEVKGKTIIKPLMGKLQNAPQDAAVVRVSFESYEGIAVSNGIMPKYVDIDPYNSSAGAFDEAIRQIIAIGGKLPLSGEQEDIFWSVNDNFCVPDSVYHPESNPDGKRKLAQLVQMCSALYDMSTFFSIPMTSGKDSMKNDFKSAGVKISVPPTVLYSAAAKIVDIRDTITGDFKSSGDLIYQVGATYNELGESELYKLLKLKDTAIPVVRMEGAKRVYKKMMEAASRKLLQSAHDISDGGMIVALAESCFGFDCGAEIVLESENELTIQSLLFSESHSRFVVSVNEKDRNTFEEIMLDDARMLGSVNDTGIIRVAHNNIEIINLQTEALHFAWSNGLTEQVI